MKIMGIVNITDDSFYPGSRALGDAAIKKALKLEAEGADIIDMGGESTRPGSEQIDSKEEIKRVIQVIEAIVDKVDAKISIDTYKYEVAKAAIHAGAEIINDITGMTDKRMRELVADENLECIIMHMQGTPKTMQKNPIYKNVTDEVFEFLKAQASLCEKDGVNKNSIIVDPGIGFGKTTEHNLEILHNIEKFKALNKRVLVGASRKSFIGKILGSEDKPVPPEDRLAGSLAVASYCAMKGVDILRVHDVKETINAIKIIERIK